MLAGKQAPFYYPFFQIDHPSKEGGLFVSDLKTKYSWYMQLFTQIYLDFSYFLVIFENVIKMLGKQFSHRTRLSDKSVKMRKVNGVANHLLGDGTLFYGHIAPVDTITPKIDYWNLGRTAPTGRTVSLLTGETTPNSQRGRKTPIKKSFNFYMTISQQVKQIRLKKVEKSCWKLKIRSILCYVWLWRLFRGKSKRKRLN